MYGFSHIVGCDDVSWHVFLKGHQNSSAALALRDFTQKQTGVYVSPGPAVEVYVANCSLI